MADWILSCCSTADLSPAFFAGRQIPYVCFHFALDEEHFPDDLGQTLPFDQFYARLAAGQNPTTSQVNCEEYVAHFTPMLQAGKDVLHLSLSSGISGSYQAACMAAAQLKEAYPARTVAVVDTLGASSGYGLLVDALADLRDAGVPLQQAVDFALQNRLQVHHWFFSTDLSYYVKGGRISKTAGMMGTLLSICPLLNMDTPGHLVPREKLRGKKKAISTIVQRMAQHARGGLEYSGKCFISHSNCIDDARAVAALVEQTFPRLDGPVVINPIGTTIASHTGPGTVALFFWGDERVD